MDKLVGPYTPPTFLWHTFEDATVPLENSLLYAAALRKNGVPFELHVFPEGEHGISLGTAQVGAVQRPGTETLRLWPEMAMRWINSEY